MKKTIALLLVLMMAVGMLAGCSSDNGGGSTQNPGGNDAPGGDTGVKLDGSWPEEKVKIGVVAFDTTDESFMSTMEYLEYLGESFNLQFIVSESLESAEQEFAFIDSCAASGCKGILAYYNIAGTESMKQATSQGMYYWGIEQYYSEMADDPYYVGSYTFSDPSNPSGNNGDYQAGYDLAMVMADSGLKHIAFCNGGASFGVKMFIDRQQGFLDGIAAAQAAGSTVRFDPATDIIEGFPGEAYFAAQAAFFSADYDGVCSAFDAFTWFQPILDSGKDIKVGCVGTVSDTYKTFVDNGTVIALIYECPELMYSSAVSNILNAATGHTELTRGADGKALLNPTQRWLLTDTETFDAVYEKRVDNGEYYITPEELATVLGGINPDASVEDINTLFNISIEDALK